MAQLFLSLCCCLFCTAAALSEESIEFKLRGDAGGEMVEIGQGSEEKLGVEWQNFSFDRTELPNAYFIVRFLNDGRSKTGDDRNVLFQAVKPTNMRIAFGRPDSEGKWMYKKWKCMGYEISQNSSENSRCNSVRKGIFAWTGSYYIASEHLSREESIEFKLRGDTGEEAVEIGQWSSETLGLDWQMFSFDRTQLRHEYFIIRFLNDGKSKTGKDRNVRFQSVKPPKMHTTFGRPDAEGRWKYKKWKCMGYEISQSSSENSRCNSVRKGNFAWNGAYYVAYELILIGSVHLFMSGRSDGRAFINHPNAETILVESLSEGLGVRPEQVSINSLGIGEDVQRPDQIDGTCDESCVGIAYSMKVQLNFTMHKHTRNMKDVIQRTALSSGIDVKITSATMGPVTVRKAISTEKAKDVKCEPYSQIACKTAAGAQCLQLGGGGFEFAGNYGTKGCYTYSSGQYKGMAYYGIGGNYSDMKKAAKSPKIRIDGADCEKKVQPRTCESQDSQEGSNDVVTTVVIVLLSVLLLIVTAVAVFACVRLSRVSSNRNIGLKQDAGLVVVGQVVGTPISQATVGQVVPGQTVPIASKQQKPT